MTTHLSSAADQYLVETLVARLRGRHEKAAELEKQARKQPGYTVQKHVATLLAAAKRFAQLDKDEVRLYATLAEARQLAGNDMRCVIMCAAVAGSSLAWRGKLAEAYIRLAIAFSFTRFLRPLDAVSLAEDITGELVFVLRCLSDSPSESAKLRQAIGN